MVDSHKAESEVVNPDPATSPDIRRALRKLSAAAAMVIMHGDPQSEAGSLFLQGLQGGLVLAVDHPEAVRVILDHFNANVSDSNLEPVSGTTHSREYAFQARRMAMDDLADAALGKNSPNEWN